MILSHWQIQAKVTFKTEPRSSPDDRDPTSDFIKDQTFPALREFMKNRIVQLMELDWHFVRTSQVKPFVVSDNPVFSLIEKNTEVYSFPVSSEVSIFLTKATVKLSGDASDDLIALMKHRTVCLAKDFVACCRRDFLGYGILGELGWLS